MANPQADALRGPAATLRAACRPARCDLDEAARVREERRDGRGGRDRKEYDNLGTHRVLRCACALCAADRLERRCFYCHARDDAANVWVVRRDVQRNSSRIVAVACGAWLVGSCRVDKHEGPDVVGSILVRGSRRYACGVKIWVEDSERAVDGHRWSTVESKDESENPINMHVIGNIDKHRARTVKSFNLVYSRFSFLRKTNKLQPAVHFKLWPLKVTQQRKTVHSALLVTHSTHTTKSEVRFYQIRKRICRMHHDIVTSYLL
ncbi:hypothetical protein B0H11DRAFT_2185520 [Mycena galericulata]|nr:hypothetical protein B0H11DRAFT_2185520 [Mycena galericulata]